MTPDDLLKGPLELHVLLVRHEVLLRIVEEAAGSPSARGGEARLIHHFKAAGREEHAEEDLCIVADAVESRTAKLRFMIKLLPLFGTTRRMLAVVHDSQGSRIRARRQVKLILKVLLIVMQINVVLIVLGCGWELERDEVLHHLLVLLFLLLLNVNDLLLLELNVLFLDGNVGYLFLVGLFDGLELLAGLVAAVALQLGHVLFVLVVQNCLPEHVHTVIGSLVCIGVVVGEIIIEQSHLLRASSALIWLLLRTLFEVHVFVIHIWVTPKLIANLIITLFKVHQVHGAVLVIGILHASFLLGRSIIHADSMRLFDILATWQVIIRVIPPSKATNLSLNRSGALLTLASPTIQSATLGIIVLVLRVVFADFVDFVELVVPRFCDVVW